MSPDSARTLTSSDDEHARAGRGAAERGPRREDDERPHKDGPPPEDLCQLAAERQHGGGAERECGSDPGQQRIGDVAPVMGERTRLSQAVRDRRERGRHGCLDKGA